MKRFLRSAVRLVPACVLFLGANAAGQLAPIKPPPTFPQVPTGTGGCSMGKSCAELAPAMIESAIGASPLEANLRYLTDTIGGRVTGSAAADQAVGWAVEALRRAGVDEVHTEKFMIPVGWSEGHTTVAILSPATFPVRLVSIGWSPPTPEGGLTADVVDVGAGDDAGFKKAGVAATGAIALVRTNVLETWDDLTGEYETDARIIRRAKNAGVAAIFWMSTRPNLLLYRHTGTVDGRLEPLPQAVVAREDAERMARLLVGGQRIRVHLEMPNKISGPVESENVVAEVRGRGKPDEFVILGAHLDSWDLGTGALDNGCDAAMVIDAARVIHASGSIPRRSIRFVLFTGEEQMMLGSWAYARAHRAELDNMAAAIFFDSGTGPVTGYTLSGRKDAFAAVREVLAPIQSLGVKEFTLDASVDTDNFDFVLEGVPTLVVNQEPGNYILNYHATSDTFDKVDMAQLKRQVAIAGVTAYALADRDERIAPRQTRAQVEEMMKETGLAEEMKILGLWPAWASGQRGREP
ncbi:MAG TPA: M28 family peptidase [Candidatus Acidoferrales bacterium]|nr:M28 family peptidase [Candidatus Acidoferrales bacterium]